MLDFFRHRRLLGHTLDELRVQQLVFALVMDVQRRDGEIDVIGQEPNPPCTATSCGLYSKPVPR